MKFLDNKRNEHDTRIGALFGTVLNKTDAFIEKHFPGYNIPFAGDDFIDADFRDVDENDDLFDEDDELRSTFYDPDGENDDFDESSNENVEVSETMIPTFALRFRYNSIGNIIEVINIINGTDEIIDRITVTESIVEGCISNEIQRYTCNIRTKETMESLIKCLNDIQILFNENIHVKS